MGYVRNTIVLSFMLLHSSGFVGSDVLYDVINEKSFCETICDKQYPTALNMPLNLGHMLRGASCCSRGCHLYNVASAHVGGVNEKRKHPNVTRMSCEASCVKAYADKNDRMNCAIGCYLVASKKHNEAIESQLSWAVYVEDGNNVLVIQPADFEPDDVLTDPGLRSQLTRGSEDRLPETHIRTLPDFGDKFLDIDIKHVRLTAGDWLDCASRKSGLPKIVLSTIILLAVVLAIWLCFSSASYSTIKLAQNVDGEIPLLADLPPKYSPRVEEV